MLESIAQLEERALEHAERAHRASGDSGRAEQEPDWMICSEEASLAASYAQLAVAGRLSHIAQDLQAIRGAVQRLAFPPDGRPAAPAPPAPLGGRPASPEFMDGVEHGLLTAEAIVTTTLARNPEGPLETALLEALRAHRTRLRS